MSFLRAPACRACLQRLSGVSGVSSQQIRTKTKTAKKGITVRLLEDLPNVGRKGSQPSDLIAGRQSAQAIAHTQVRLSP